MPWWRPFSRSDQPTGAVGAQRRGVRAIRRDVLDLICELGKENHPNEYGCGLRAEAGIISELVLVPGMIGGDRHTFMNTWNLPTQASIVGTVHSHPSPYPIPSDADRQFFSHFGSIHLIVAAPYDRRSWRAYDLTAREVKLQVVE